MKKRDLYAAVHFLPDEICDEAELVRWKRKAAVMMSDIISTRLTGRQKEIIVLYYYDGMLQKEIAERLGVTESDVSHIKGRALRRLEYDLNLIRS